MSSYSGLERSIARLLGRFPAIKQFAKVAYSRLVYLRARKSYRYRAAVEPVRFCDKGNSSFFGYYDKSPANSNGQVLFHSVSQGTKTVPSKEDSVELVVADNGGKVLHRLAVKAYNWQQGCRAHWVTDDLFIFNDFNEDGQRYISRVFSVSEQREMRHFDYPVQDSFGTEYFISLNYRRLMTLRPDYGYRNLPGLTPEELGSLNNDGIWRVDFETGDAYMLVSLAQACAFSPKPEFRQAVHKFNHVMISPSGSQLIVMHRYLIGQRRFDRLLLVDVESGEMDLLSDYGMVSHCFWVDDNVVLGYLRGPKDKDGYWLINTQTGEFSPCAQDALSGYGDGHPHVFGDWFVTDTYPDKARMQHLLLANWKTGEVKELGEFFHGFEYSGESRCDLHPRFSQDGRAVFFDSVFTGHRQLYRMELAH